MAWAGKASGRQKTALSIKGRRLPHRAPPPPDLPPGGIVPRSVMKQLSWAQLPFDKAAYQEKLVQLMQAIKANGGG